MFKVIVERPRVGRSYARKGRREAMRVREAPEDASSRGPMGRGRGTKRLNENLAPLRRYLCAQVGRPWAVVYAEICAHIKLGSAVQQHVLQHLDEMVVLDVVMEGKRATWRVTGRPVYGSLWRSLVYVDPNTGLLRRSPPRPRPKPTPVRDRMELRDGDQLQRIGGVWYHVTLMPIPDKPAERRAAVDVLLGVRLDKYWMLSHLEARYGREGVYATAKRQVGKRALARMLPEDLR